jgi:ferredoxin
VTSQLRVNPIACSGHGLCAELLPELISLDEWGYPVIADRQVPPRLARQARRAVTDCPALALRLARPRSGPAVPGPARGVALGQRSFRRNAEARQTGARECPRILEV